MTLRGLACLVLLCGPLACGPGEDGATAPPVLADWDERIELEEQVLALRPALRALERSLRNLELPDAPARSRFDTTVLVRDATGRNASRVSEVAGSSVTHTEIAPGDWQPPRAPGEVRLWRRALDPLLHVERAEVAVAEADFADATQRRLDTELRVSARARKRDGFPQALRAVVDAQWVRRGDGDWRIARWDTRALELDHAPRAFFREVLDEVLTDPEALRRARVSRHERLVAEKLLRPESFRAPHRHFFQGSQDRHPGIAVTDLNADGFDDLYVMARWGPNQLLLSRGDGRYDERAGDYGLDLADHSSAALFADFDNDGDADLFLGRTLARSVYLENREGRFVDRTREALGPAAPGLVSSVSAADVDGDGLLDLYVSTYAAQMIVTGMLERERARRSGVTRGGGLLAEHLPEAAARELEARVRRADAHIYLSLPGPPNLLLRNQGGGRFRVDPDAGPLAAFRNTYQATFSDYDADGDADVYLAHDFAPNQLLRNEGGRFVDVTDETGTADIGFGMGVTWGDYDNDGRQDLYVSNMYSKAGRRITRGLAEAGSELPKMARGNTLFRNTGGRFEQVSGEGRGDLQVEAAGWSWGGQFGDVDNDGFLDLYALAGYYTAPPEAALDVDV